MIIHLLLWKMTRIVKEKFLNYKDTYTILFEDGNRKRHTVKVDIPKFIDNQFMYLGGNNKIIKHQNFYLPVVKVDEDMVEIVTNYSKLTLQRVDNKSTSSAERLSTFIVAILSDHLNTSSYITLETA